MRMMTRFRGGFISWESFEPRGFQIVQRSLTRIAWRAILLVALALSLLSLPGHSLIAVFPRPGGTAGEVQYEGNGQFKGETNFTYDEDTDTLSVSSVTISGVATLSGPVTLSTTTVTNPATFESSVTFKSTVGIEGEVNEPLTVTSSATINNDLYASTATIGKRMSVGSTRDDSHRLDVYGGFGYSGNDSPGIAINNLTDAGTGETYITHNAKDAAGNLTKIAVVNAQWVSNSTTTGYAFEDMHVTYMDSGTSHDDSFLRGWGNHGAMFFWDSHNPPGRDVVQVNGGVIISSNATHADGVHDKPLHVWGGSAGAVDSRTEPEVTIEDDGDTGIQLLCPVANTEYIVFGDSDANNVAWIRYIHSTDTMNFKVGTTSLINMTATTMDPVGAGAVSSGDGTNYWNDISYKTLTDRGCLGSFDDGVEMRDGRRVSDTEALLSIKPDPRKNTIYGVPMLDYRSFPKACYKPATYSVKEKGKTVEKPLPRDENDEPYYYEVTDGDRTYKIYDEKAAKKLKSKIKKTAADGIEMTSVFSIMIGAQREQAIKVRNLESRVYELEEKLKSLYDALEKANIISQ